MHSTSLMCSSNDHMLTNHSLMCSSKDCMLSNHSHALARVRVNVLELGMCFNNNIVHVRTFSCKEHMSLVIAPTTPLNISQYLKATMINFPNKGGGSLTNTIRVHEYATYYFFATMWEMKPWAFTTT